LRYIGIHDVRAIALGAFFSTTLHICLGYFLEVPLPRSVPILFASFSLILVGGSRIIMRSMLGHVEQSHKVPILIFGAGEAGRLLANALSEGKESKVVGFIDHDPVKIRTVIRGITVFSPTELERVIESKGIKRILLAIPSASRDERKVIIDQLGKYPVQVLSIPSLPEILSGKAQVNEFKEIAIEELLGRDPVPPSSELMAANIKGKSIMVTGAGGTIGSELCRLIIEQKPKVLVLFELSEYQLYKIERELREKIQSEQRIELIPVLGNIRDEERVRGILKQYGVQTVYHAAAYKHVPLVEHNMAQGIMNNVFGTLSLARAAIATKVESFVLVSSDKAVRPTSVMGATKRLAELILQAYAFQDVKTRFCMVRFGNVLGSSGSVVPLFHQQIQAGGPVTITDPEITRFFMTISEAAQLVIQAGAMGKGGDVFLLDMGESVKIIDLAKKMIHLSGFREKTSAYPDGDIEIRSTGLRPGEKLYEELLIGESAKKTQHPRIMTALEDMVTWSALDKILNNLLYAIENDDYRFLRETLMAAPLNYRPSSDIVDWLHNDGEKLQALAPNVSYITRANASQTQ
jgi:FlaA1/EpsC-like NDP-sugar epimerase